MPTTHAFLAPSASKRWMACPPSAQAESVYSETDTIYTKEGTIAHSCAEAALRSMLRLGLTYVPDLDDFLQFGDENYFQDVNALRDQMTELGFDRDDFREMQETVYSYYVSPVYEDYLAGKAIDPDAQLLVEAELNLSSFIPEGFGSSDAVIIANDTVAVYDLKYGKGVKVSAEHNPQMMCYALGAVYGPAELYSVDWVTMTILQPRLHHESRFSMGYDDLVKWGKTELRPAAEIAFRGEGDYHAGDHCKFCKNAPRCVALAKFATVTAEANAEPERLTLEELGQVLGKLDTIKSWAAHLEEYCQKLIMDGAKLPGWKLVEGRSISRLSDPARAIDILHESGFTNDVILKAPELKTITDLKKILRPKTFDMLLGSLVVKPQGKPTIVPESDPRKEFNSAETDFSNV